MKTRRPNLVTMPHEFYIDETDTSREAVARGLRSQRSQPIGVGRVVVLYFVSRIVGADGEHFTQPLRVRVTARHRRDPLRYRGELLEQPDRKLFDPRREIRRGSQVEFTNAHVVYAGKLRFNQ